MSNFLYCNYFNYLRDIMILHQENGNKVKPFLKTKYSGENSFPVTEQKLSLSPIKFTGELIHLKMPCPI